MKLQRLIILILISCISFLSFAQNPIGMPDIVNYDNSHYGAGSHNWDIEQDRNGVLYFANDEGLLTFDGDRWKIYPLPNKTIVRSIKIANDNRIYAGGQGDFGYFSPNEHGKLVFFSLKEKIPSMFHSFADIWNIESVDDGVFFRSERYIFKWDGDKISVIESESKWLYMGAINNFIVAQDQEKGLLKLDKKTWSPLLEDAFPANFEINSMSRLSKDSVLINSVSHGAHIILGNQIFTLKSTPSIQNVTHAAKINQHTQVLATLNNGCFLIDANGDQLYHLSKSSGLQNNAVLSLFVDNNENIWLGLADGISFVANNKAIKHINPSVFDNMGGHTSMMFKNSLYLGLSNGVFQLQVSDHADISSVKSKFEPVKNALGQAWGMNVVNDKLLLGKHEGAYEIKNNIATPLAQGKGYWNFVSLSPYSSVNPLILSGNYHGVSTFELNHDKLAEKGAIANFNESARFIVLDEKGNVWVSHPYKGVYKIFLTADLKTKETVLYTSHNGLPSTYNNHIYFVKNKVVVGTESGVYEYNEKNDRFEISTYFKNIFGEKYIRYLKEDQYENIWFIEDKKIGVARFVDRSYHLLYIPELSGKTLGGFEHINCIDNNNIIIGGQRGFYHLNFEKYLSRPNNQHIVISSVKAFGKLDSLLFSGYFGEVNENALQTSVPRIKHELNSFHFEYSSTLNQNRANILYSCYLKGFDEGWSNPDKKTEKVYTNLPAGDYVFMVKTQDNLGNESEVASYKFTVLPPWYQSIWAFIIYGLMFFGTFYMLYKKQQRKIINQRIAFQKEQEHIKYMHQLEMDKSDKEIIKLKNEKLEIEIETKNSELATNAMHLVQKAEFFSNIKNELFKLKKELKDGAQITDFNKIIRLLDTEEKSDESWEQFAGHFDKVHVDFLKHLKEAYPRITSTELRLSAYLKMNLSTKEIAQLMKISPRGVEIGRYRLRKKLDLPSHTNLFEFFNSI